MHRHTHINTHMKRSQMQLIRIKKKKKACTEPNAAECYCFLPGVFFILKTKITDFHKIQTKCHSCTESY